MKFKIGAAVSILALSLFAGTTMAQDSGQDAQPVQEQPATEQPATEQPVTESAPAALPDQVLALINDSRNASELKDDELKKRAQAARRAAKLESLPADVRQQLQALSDADRAELETRAQTQTPDQQQTGQSEPPPPETKKKKEAAQDSPPPAPAALPQEVVDLLADNRQVADLSNEELAARAKQARGFAKDESLPEDIRSKLAAIGKEARSAMAEREKQQQEQQTEQQQPVEKKKPEATAQDNNAPPPPPQPAAGLPQEVMDLLADKRPAAELSTEELAARAKQARGFARDEKLPEDVRNKLGAISKDARSALLEREKPQDQQQTSEQPPQKTADPAPVTEPPKDNQTAAPAQPPAPPPVDKADVKQLDGNAGDPAAEKQAKAYLADKADIEKLPDEELRKRLDGIRNLMAENELSSETERAVREKLRKEREVLRNRVAEQRAEQEVNTAEANAAQPKDGKSDNQAADPAQGKDGKRKKNGVVFNPNINILITPETPAREVLRDMRPSDELADVELERRIRVYRDVESDNSYDSYDPEMRARWRETMRRDRERLHERMMAEREARRQQESRRYDANIRIEDDNAGYEDGIPDDMFAAEVDDNDIERALVAPPRRKINRKVTIEEIAAEPAIRNSVTRIEIDTIHFGFNEAFVREEEVDNLDAIATVIEKVLRKYPREVFLIEGHTDAVGSNAYNVQLSKARAEAVKKALVSYYVIPARNLQTVGLGESYLKIPTAEAEGENRRVSISRITSLVGELDD